MLKVGMSKSEIEKEIASKGNFVQIDWLTRYLKEDLTMDMKKFIYLKLAEIYEKTGMYKEAAKMYDNMANLAITYVEKIKHYMKAVEAHIKGGDVYGSDEAVRKANSQANTMQREEIYKQTIDFYKIQGDVFEKTNKRANAVQIYEKLSQMRLGEIEKREVKDKLRNLYEQLGRRKELQMLDRK